MANNIERTISVKYELFSRPLGLVKIQEPSGYDNDTRGYSRDTESRGFIVKTEIDLEFYGNGADYITTLHDVYGINEKCTLTKYERDVYSLSESFKPRYIQEIDLGTYKRDSKTGKVTVNATEGGLFKDVKNRESDEYDLINNESADGVAIGELQTEVFAPIPRSLFLESYLKQEFEGYRLNSVPREAGAGAITRGVKTIPLNVVYKSGDRVKNPYNASSSSNAFNDSESLDIGSVEDVGNIFYWRSDIDRTITFKLELDYTIVSKFDRFVTGTGFNLVIRKSKIDPSNNINDILIEKEVLQTFNYQTNIGVAKTIEQTYEYDLLEGESLAICFETFATTTGGSVLGSPAVIQLYIDVSKSELIIEDDTDYDPSTSRCTKPLVFFNRLLAKITGKQNVVTSSIFGSGGEYENIVIDNGFWCRQFPDTYNDPNGDEQSIQMVTSFKNAFESFNYLEPLCWFTYFEGNEEKLRIEKATFTQQNFIGLDLGFVDNINSESSKIDVFSNIKIGHTQSMEYEELSGLDEPNGLSEFNTFITRNESKYEVLSKYRVDATGYELIRRKPFDRFPKEDTKRDANIFLHDAIRLENGVYTHAVWNTVINGQQVLDELPKGVFKPHNLWNFRLSPINRLFYGHGYSVKRGLYHFPEKFIRFNSSNANQNLITVIDGFTLAENGSLQIRDIPKPRVEAEKVNFTFKMTQLIEDTLLGFTKVNGEFIPNYFGLIKYKEKGEDKYGRLIKLETQDEAKMEVIKARL